MRAPEGPIDRETEHRLRQAGKAKGFMVTEYFKIAGGTVHDPANGIDGEVRDIWIAGGKIALPPADPEIKPARVLDAGGRVVMPGGIDMHCHIVGPKVNAARRICPEQKRRGEPVRRTKITHSGTMGSVPSTFATGYKYAGLGYTTAFDAAIPPLSARHAHEEFADTPCIDKGFYILVGNNHYLMRSIQQGEPQKVKALIGWLLSSASSKVAPLADHVNANPNLTVDVGQVIFGETLSMTGDGPLGYYLSKIRDRSVLSDLDREYSLSEIAIITRAGPARILGLKHKGHLGPGADADITIYTPSPNQETMFELP